MVEPSFIEAEGWGAYSQGGSGGPVITVTNLYDLDLNGNAIPGSLRAACETPGKRIVVFQVSGIIMLDKPLRIGAYNDSEIERFAYITIDGRTAPPPGVCIRGDGVEIELTHDVVLRNLQIRPGFAAYFHRGRVSGSDSEKNKGYADGLSIRLAENVIVEHCSISWAVDTVVDIRTDVDLITIQDCIISEGLAAKKGEPGGMLIHRQGIKRVGKISLIRNIFANNVDRNPSIVALDEEEFLLDIRENIVAGHSITPFLFSTRPESKDNTGKISANWIANYIYDRGDHSKNAAISRNGQYVPTVYMGNEEIDEVTMTKNDEKPTKSTISSNYRHSRVQPPRVGDVGQGGDGVLRSDTVSGPGSCKLKEVFVPFKTRHTIPIDNYASARRFVVLQNAGALVYKDGITCRNRVDQRIIDEIASYEEYLGGGAENVPRGKIWSDFPVVEEQVGGYSDTMRLSIDEPER